MGASGQSKSNQKQDQLQHQIIEQNYANNIMLMTFSTLQSVCRMIKGIDKTSSKKKFGSQDKVDYSSKTMPELISQFKTHLFLLKVSKEEMDKQFKSSQGFIFPKNFQKQSVLNEISLFREICRQSHDEKLLMFCDDFSKIINGEYTNLAFERVETKVQYNQKERQKHKSNLIKIGINATNAMQELKDQIINSGVQNPSDLSLKFNSNDVEQNKMMVSSSKMKK